MGLRFRKSIRLLPGVRLNLSKSGPSSISVGGKGLTYNLGKKGARGTAGLPGTGLSYSHYDRYAEGKPETHIDQETGEITEQPAQDAGLARFVVPVCIALIVGAIYFLRG